MSDDYDWRHTKVVPMKPHVEYKKIKNSFKPHTNPYNFLINTERRIKEMEPTEYLIGYSNEFSAIGVAKDIEKLTDQPLTMQFGSVDEHIGREIYIGCTLIVKSFARMVYRKNNSPFPITGRNATYKDIFLNDRLRASTLAIDWAIVSKPKLEQSLGTVIDFKINTRQDDEIYYTGRVKDQQSGSEIEVQDDYWPMSIQGNVPTETPVLITLVRIEGPHASCSGYVIKDTLFPSGSSKLDLGVEEVPGSDYWFGWISFLDGDELKEMESRLKELLELEPQCSKSSDNRMEDPVQKSIEVYCKTPSNVGLSLPLFNGTEVFRPKSPDMTIHLIKSLKLTDDRVRPIDMEIEPTKPLEDDELEWRHTTPLDPGKGASELFLTFLPRIPPLNYFVNTDDRAQKMETTEYLIGYCNEYTAIGIAKGLEGLGNKPLTMQFGTRQEPVQRDIYLGCTAVAKSYVRMINFDREAFRRGERNYKRFVGLDADYRSLFYKNRLCANTLAVEWAVKHKPQILRTMGTVIDFKSIPYRSDSFEFSARVKDQENQVEIDVVDDQLPQYMKEELKIESAVVISWIKVQGAHASCPNNEGRRTLFPSGSSVLNTEVEEIRDSDYWFGWIDSSFKKSRSA